MNKIYLLNIYTLFIFIEAYAERSQNVLPRLAVRMVKGLFHRCFKEPIHTRTDPNLRSYSIKSAAKIAIFL